MGPSTLSRTTPSSTVSVADSRHLSQPLDPAPGSASRTSTRRIARCLSVAIDSTATSQPSRTIADPLGNVLDLVEFVRGEEHRPPRGRSLADQLEHVLLAKGIEPARSARRGSAAPDRA